MRFAKHILPLALVITGVIAADDESTTEVAKTKATATDDKATKTTNEAEETKGSDKTEEAEPTATGDEDEDKDSADKETSTGKNSKAKVTSATETTQSIVSWDPPQPSTMAPDINASSRSIQTSGYLALTMVGIVSIAAAFL
ncbi:hypothetical protein BHE90_006973 [Fusarium euwallaceae]|uniref:Uncharacterized protein n=1 Tax=Fusarium euwallaceae TaxID=1147111 RepID=A0A430LS52_9HYPO|nr:hypothetical protein BHE90_006973 [Fusarium euwallaceae]